MFKLLLIISIITFCYNTNAYTSLYPNLKWEHASELELKSRYQKNELCLISVGAVVAKNISSSLDRNDIERISTLSDTNCTNLSFEQAYRNIKQPGCTILGGFHCEKKRALPVTKRSKKFCTASFPDRLNYLTSSWKGLPPPLNNNLHNITNISYYSSLLLTLKNRGIRTILSLGDSISRSFGDTMYSEYPRASNNLKQLNLKRLGAVTINYVPCGLVVNNGVLPMRDPKASYRASKCTEEKQMKFMTNRTTGLVKHSNNSILLMHPFAAHIWHEVGLGL